MSSTRPGRGARTPEETPVVRLRPHARVLVGPSLALLVITGGAAYAVGQLPEQWLRNAVALTALLLAVALWLLPLLRWLGTGYVITTRRILVRSGLLVRRRREVLLTAVTSIDVQQTPMQSLLRCGDLRLVERGESVLVLADVPTVALVEAALHELREL